MKNKNATTSTQNAIRNKMKTPHPASSLGYRPAKLLINLTWPNKLNIIQHLTKIACEGKIWFWLYSRDQPPIFETWSFFGIFGVFYIM